MATVPPETRLPGQPAVGGFPWAGVTLPPKKPYTEKAYGTREFMKPRMTRMNTRQDGKQRNSYRLSSSVLVRVKELAKAAWCFSLGGLWLVSTTASNECGPRGCFKAPRRSTRAKCPPRDVARLFLRPISRPLGLVAYGHDSRERELGRSCATAGRWLDLPAVLLCRRAIQPRAYARPGRVTWPKFPPILAM
jgi:hypothetical protein